MNHDWNTTVWGLMLRILQLLLILWAAVGLMRVCAWVNEPVKPPITTPAGVNGTL